jgi:outer membrane immunogenic protein
MRKLLAATTMAAAILASGAQAADLPLKGAYPARVVQPGWTGCYSGFNSGWGWASKNAVAEQVNGGGVVIDSSTTPVDLDGWLLGVQAGCDYQLTRFGHPFWNHVVIGIQGSWSWADIKGDGSFVPLIGNPHNEGSISAKVNRIASVTGRLGWSFENISGQTFLAYFKGGVAWVHDKYNAGIICNGPGNSCNNNPSDALAGAFTQNRNGWVIGGGIEYPVRWAFWNSLLGSGWTTFLEYNHYEFGSKTFQNDATRGRDLRWNIDQKVDTVTLGMNYHFWTGPLW